VSKTARFFAGLRAADDDPENAYLRVTSYRDGHHVRFSVWVGDRAQCVMSIPESEARELAAFLTAETQAAQAV
jgi:hypothetical protein